MFSLVDFGKFASKTPHPLTYLTTDWHKAQKNKGKFNQYVEGDEEETPKLLCPKKSSSTLEGKEDSLEEEKSFHDNLLTAGLGLFV